MLFVMPHAAVYVLALCLLLPGCGGGGGSGGSGVGDSEAGSAVPVGPSSVDEALEQAVSSGVDGAILVVLSGDSPVQSFVAGRRERSGDPMTIDTVFKMASVSKLYIAVAAIQLVHQGLISLDDSVASSLPALASRIENSDAISLRLLLQHRSGVPDFDSQAGFSWRSSHPDVQVVLGYALDLPADFAPDSRYEYSNTNYLLAAMMLDAALGYSHHTHIQNFILDPLGLVDTWHVLGEVDPALLASGYWDGADMKTQEYAVPGGSMLATAADIARFLHALARGDLLDPAAQADYESVYWLNHSGWLPGYQTIARYEAALDATLVLHVNTTGGASETVLSRTYDQVVALLRR